LDWKEGRNFKLIWVWEVLGASNWKVKVKEGLTKFTGKLTFLIGLRLDFGKVKKVLAKIS